MQIVHPWLEKVEQQWLVNQSDETSWPQLWLLTSWEKKVIIKNDF